jgi:hypothetical protein
VNVSHVEIPDNASNIKIIITEPTPTGRNTPTQIHLVEADPIEKRTIKQISTNRTAPMYEIVELPPLNRTNITRDLRRDYTNTSVTDSIGTGNTFLTSSSRYISVS